MRPAMTLRSAALAAILAGAASAAGGQDLRTDCVATNLDTVTNTAQFGARERFHPNANRTRDTLNSLADAVSALRAIRADFAADPGLSGAHPWRQALLQQLDSAIGDVERTRDSVSVLMERSGDTTGAVLAWGAVAHVRFKAQFAGSGIDPAPGAPSIHVDNTTPAAERQAVCWAGRRAGRVLAQLAAGAMELTARALTATLRDWDHFDREGLSQYPWEAALNGRKGFCPLPVQGPPTCQWVIAHPSLGYALRDLGGSGDVAARLRGTQAVVVDVIGRIWYRNGWRSYRGWSAFALVGNQPPGAGLTLHLDRAVQIGAGVGVGPTGKWDRGIGYLSLDAYRWVSEMPAKLRDRREVVRRVRDIAAGQAAGGAP